MSDKKRWALIILDGFGISNEKSNNGIALAKTPTYDALCKNYPMAELQASEEHVALPKGQMGNSEVGHLTIGAGRLVRQGLTAIDFAINSGEFDKNYMLNQAIQLPHKIIHIMGLFSDGGVHSHQNHFIKTCEFFANAGFSVFMHLFLDGRDTEPKAILKSLPLLKQLIKKHPKIQIATMMGRFYAMDRDKRWDRTEKAYQAIVKGEGEGTSLCEIEETIEKIYKNGVNDEFFEPLIFDNYKGMQDGNQLIHINFRADRVRQLLASLVLPDFSFFCRDKPPHFSNALGMSFYSEELSGVVKALYPNEPITDGIVQILSSYDKKILKIAETEKYAHVTFFFNGGIEEPVKGEDRILVPSPKVKTYDQTPQMSAPQITQQFCNALKQKKHDFIVVNYANPDMVGHTGNRDAIIHAIECIDDCLREVIHAAKENDYGILLTADHGNAECMFDIENQSMNTAHTLNPVPFLLIDDETKEAHLKNGSLRDIAPTLLKLFNIPQPQTMTGSCLII
jgi:2,3-bisphosphoglycerate-independent phosphoglycerate mutase